VSEQFIYSTADVLAMLDELVMVKEDAWWDGFYTDRARRIPFFVEWPDENLVEWVRDGRLTPGRALELGCGPARNARYLAELGYQVDAVDYSAAAIDWARERLADSGVSVNLLCCSIFDAELGDESYDLVYDSGCLHHLAPHRRKDYLELVLRVLKPGGSFGLVCFRPEGGGGLTDREVYENRGLAGGLGYSRERLLALCGDRLDVVHLRQMIKSAEGTELFGEDFLGTLLATKPRQ
jgi:SAM-dependent methyltransferase